MLSTSRNCRVSHEQLHLTNPPGTPSQPVFGFSHPQKVDIGSISQMLAIATKCGFGFEDLDQGGLVVKANYLFYRCLLETILTPFFNAKGMSPLKLKQI